MAAHPGRNRPDSSRAVASLRTALLLLVAVAFLAGMLPAGVVLERWLARELERRVQRDLSTAPGLVATRDAALHDAMMMHAKELAHDPSVAAVLRSQDRTQALAIVETAARSYNYDGVLIEPAGSVLIGPAAAASLVRETAAGGMPVRVVGDRTGLHLVSVAPVLANGEWVGAVGVSLPLDAAAAGALAGLTHSDVVLLVGADQQWAVTSGDSTQAAAIASAWRDATAGNGVQEVRAGGTRYYVTAASLGGATALFVRDIRRELAMLPMLRRAVLITGAGALAVALLLGYILAGWIAQPVRDLAAAAGRLSGGDFGAPLPGSAVREVARVSDAFGDMRHALAARLDELRSANRMLEERQARLSALQSELIKRERVTTSARMAAELAHEIRNPVANIRNCLELLERRLGHDAEGREFAGMAIEELLRMHELAERMLHLNRPRDLEAGSCDAESVAREVVTLADLGNMGGPMLLSLDAAGPMEVALPADALKQILLNLVQNAREAMPQGLALQIGIRASGEQVRITVSDNGPGIPTDLRERIFDPFFTTRGQAGGIGLGLFLVEGMVRAHGGTVSLLAGPAGTGACFELMLPGAAASPARGLTTIATADR